jgi:hypothetical protein
MKYYVNVGLEFDVSVPVTADTDGEAEDKVNDMELSELLDWAGCASFVATIHDINEE